MGVTVKQIADIVGVSRGTVDRALHDRGDINPQVRERILAVARELEYQPNLVGKQLSAKKLRHRFGIILPIDDDTGFWSDVHRGIRIARDELHDFGVEVLCYTYSRYTAGEQIVLIDRLLADGISGMAISPLNLPPIREKLQSVADKGIPVVLLNSTVEGFSPLCYVGADYERSGRAAAGLLQLIMQQRHIELAVMAGSKNMSSHTARINGFLQELARLQADCHLINTYKIYSEKESSDKQIAYDVTREMLAERPEVNTVFSAAGTVCAVAQAIADAGRVGSLTHLTFDLNSNTYPCLMDGSITAVIGQESVRQGYQPLNILFDYVINEVAPPADRIILKNEIYIRQNATEEQITAQRGLALRNF